MRDCAVPIDQEVLLEEGFGEDRQHGVCTRLLHSHFPPKVLLQAVGISAGLLLRCKRGRLQQL